MGDKEGFNHNYWEDQLHCDAFEIIDELPHSVDEKGKF